MGKKLKRLRRQKAREAAAASARIVEPEVVVEVVAETKTDEKPLPAKPKKKKSTLGTRLRNKKK
jgi:hypothetical protein